MRRKRIGFAVIGKLIGGEAGQFTQEFGRKSQMKASELSQRLDDFKKVFHPSLQSLLTISAHYDLKADWPNTWPDNENPGVYILLNQQEDILYIGKSSWCIGSRLNAHFHRGSNGEAISYSKELAAIRFIWTIGLPKDKRFLSSALEEYLIAELDPDLNKIGRIT